MKLPSFPSKRKTVSATNDSDSAVCVKTLLQNSRNFGYSSFHRRDMHFRDRNPRRDSRLYRTAWCALVLLAVVLLAFVPAVCADDGKTLRVCIPYHTASDAQLHQVATTLSGHKPDKASHLRAQGVELASLDQILYTDDPYKGRLANQALTGEVRDRANKELCDYLLVISLPDVKTARSAQPNAWNPDQQSTANTRDPYMRRQDPDYYVEVKYRLYRLNPAADSSDGLVSTHDAAPQQAVVAHALDMLANQVFSKITK